MKEIESDEGNARNSNLSDCFTGKDEKTVWKKTKFHQIIRT